MASLPTPVRAYIGLLATAVDQAQQLIRRAPELPVEMVGNTMQLSMRAQQRYTELVARGDNLLGHLKPTPAQPPSWATFDEDEPGSADATTDDLSGDLTGGAAEHVADAGFGLDFDDEIGADAFGAGARFEEDDHPIIAVESGTPLASHGDPLVADIPTADPLIADPLIADPLIADSLITDPFVDGPPGADPLADGPLVAGSDGVIALPAKTRAARTAAPRKRTPRSAAARSEPVAAPTSEADPPAADLPAMPEALLGQATAKRAAARARKATPPPALEPGPSNDHVTLSTFEIATGADAE